MGRGVALRFSGPTQQRGDAGDELQDAERFGDVVVRPEPESPDFVGLLSVRRQDEHRHVQAVLAQRSQDAIAIEARKHQVQDDEIRPRASRLRQSCRTVGRDFDDVTLNLEIVPKAISQIRVVLDDQDRAHAGTCEPDAAASLSGAAGSASGSSTTKREPPPGASSTQTVPPWSVTRSRTTARLMPVPATADAAAGARR